jgi:ribosomal-protein-alanine N-acetyltransferase
MDKQPELITERLVSRPFALSDAPVVQELAGDRAIAASTGTIPHPYEDGMAEGWIGTHRQAFEEDKEAVFAITLREGGSLIGRIGLTIDRSHERAELGYWIGKPYWGNGYCTEAARAVVQFGFEDLELNRIYATHFARNPASGRVMAKTGMTREGCRRQHFQKWGVLEDLITYAILRSEFGSQSAGAFVP